MSTLIPIEYVGKKPTAFDNVAQSRKVWNGAGDIQEVTEDQAKILLKYPDQWALANVEDQAAVSKPPAPIPSTDGTGAPVSVNQEELKINMDNMSVAQLRAYALEKFGKKVGGTSRKDILDNVEELIRTEESKS